MERSTVSTPAAGEPISPGLREVAAALLPDAARLAAETTAYFREQIPELASGDEELWEETRASTAANYDQILRLIKAGTGADALSVPFEAAEWPRGLVRRGIALHVLLRTYRLGHEWVWARLSQALTEHIADPDALAVARDQCSAFLFAYVDRISGELVDAYGTERERVVRSAEQLRADTVRAILAGDAVDEEIAARRLGYELRRHHVALRVFSGAGPARGTERAAHEVVAAAGLSDPLVVTSGIASYDVWAGSFDPFGPDLLTLLERYGPPDGVRVAVGTPGHGIAGFRASRAEALQAARIATLAGAVARPVTTYPQVEVASLLCNDLPRARAFAASRLGALAADTDQAARLRETVLAFLVAGGSSSRVARDLFVHQNTVGYRVKRAEELLGHRVSDDVVGLTAALTLTAALGTGVLADAG